MLEKLYELAIDGGGIWCVLCVYLIVRQNQRYEKLEQWVKEEVITAINAATHVMTEIKERMDADKHDRDSGDS